VGKDTNDLRVAGVTAERPDDWGAPNHEIRSGIPATIREAAAKESPGRITSVEHYVTSNVDVFVLRIDAADGCRELKIRQDGVVLLNTLNPVETQAGFEMHESTRVSREIPE